MKRIFLIVSAWLFFSSPLFAQKRPYKVVFDLTSKDSTAQQSVMRWIKEILNNEPSAQIEVVMYGQGIDMVIQNQASYPVEIERLAGSPQVQFKVCAIALKNHQYSPSQLLTGVTTVPDGIYEIISKEAEGWGYIKVTR